MRWDRKYLNLMYFGRKLEVTSLQFKYYTLLNFRLRNRVFLLWSRWRKWYLIIRLLSPFYFSTKRKEKSALAILIICECLPGRLLQCQQFFLSFSEPRTEILGDQELFVDYASSLNLTCLVISPNPPAFVFWKLSEKVSNKIKVYGH